MPNYYLAITIGPVYKTIKKARSTRELWASSYIFSALLREILIASKGKLGTLLSPALDKDERIHRYGAGVYPDRAFWKLDSEADKDQLGDIIQSAFKTLVSISGISTNQQSDYFRIYGVQIVREEDYKPSVILELNKLLDNWELQEKITGGKTDITNLLDENIQSLYNDGHQQDPSDREIFIWYDCEMRDIKRLPSIIEISTSDLKLINRTEYKEIVTDVSSKKICELKKSGTKGTERVKQEIEEQDEIIQNLKLQFKTDFKLRHKYIAFVKADGDKMGATLGEIGNDESKINQFSNLLSQFTRDATQLIVKYGGLPVYAGGDDLLFVLPMMSADIETNNDSADNLFELIHKIDDVFPEVSLANLTNNVIKPTLSYGISVSYYKFPMAETLDVSDDALYRAKAFPGKNAISFEVRKHSGQQFGTTLGKQVAYAKFFEMIRDFYNFKEDAFLTSVMHTLIELKPLYTDAIEKKSLIHFFKHQFNEKDHGTKFDTYLTSVRELTELLQQEFSDPSKVADSVFAILRFIQFLNQPDHE